LAAGGWAVISGGSASGGRTEALRMSSTPAQFWLNLQDQYNLDVEEDQIRAELDAIQPLKIA
jgi:hypothetical protein